MESVQGATAGQGPDAERRGTALAVQGHVPVGEGKAPHALHATHRAATLRPARALILTAPPAPPTPSPLSQAAYREPELLAPPQKHGNGKSGSARKG